MVRVVIPLIPSIPITELNFLIFFLEFHFQLTELLYFERDNVTQYHESFPAALVIYRDEDTKNIQMKILFSGNSLHSLAATINLIDNFQLQLLTNGNNSITTINAPMHR